MASMAQPAPRTAQANRQWAAAHVLDKAPFLFVPITEARRWRDELAVEIARDVVQGLVGDTDEFEALDDLVTELLPLDSDADGCALLYAIVRGEA